MLIMLFYNYYKNYIVFDTASKFSIRASYFITKQQSKLTINSSDFLQNTIPFRSVPLFFAFFALFGNMPASTKIKKAVSKFKTVKGNLHGVKLVKRSLQFFMFLEYFFKKIKPFLNKMGYKQSFNLNRDGVGVFSAQNIKTFGLFSKTFLKYLSYDIGIDFSINCSFTGVKKKENKTLFLLSGFQHIIFQNNNIAEEREHDE